MRLAVLRRGLGLDLLSLVAALWALLRAILQAPAHRPAARSLGQPSSRLWPVRMVGRWRPGRAAPDGDTVGGPAPLVARLLLARVVR